MKDDQLEEKSGMSKVSNEGKVFFNLDVAMSKTDSQCCAEKYVKREKGASSGNTRTDVEHKMSLGYNNFCESSRFKKKSADDSNKTENIAAGMTVDEKALELCGLSAKLSLVDLAKDDELWVGDTGASRHMAKTKKGLVNVRKASPTEGFTLGNGANARAAIVGDLMGTVGNTKIKVSDVTYCPTAKFNLFSTSLLLMKGWKMRGDEKGITMTKEPNKIIRFNTIVKTAKGMLFCVRIKCSDEIGMSALDENSKDWTKIMNIQRLHDELGHMGEQACRKIAKQCDIKLTKNTFKTCEACAVAKARQKEFE